MTSIVKDYRIRVHDKGTTTPADGTVDFTITASELAGRPIFPTQSVFPLEGRAASGPGEFVVLDSSDFLSAKIADAGGRLDLLRRFAEYQINTDAAGWTTTAIARITNVALDSNIAAYRVTVQDERFIERNAEAWTSSAINTSRRWLPGYLIPQYIHEAGTPLISSVQYGPWAFHTRPARTDVAQTSGNLRRVTIEMVAELISATGVPIWPNLRMIMHYKTVGPGTVDAIKADLKGEDGLTFSTSATAGNFTNLRCRIDGTDYEVFGFGENVPTNAEEITKNLDSVIIPPAPTGDPYASGYKADLYCWVVAPGGLSVSYGRLYMPGAPPSRLAPLFVGGRTGTHPVQLAQWLLEDAGVRIDTTAFAALIDDRSFPLVRFKIEGPENLAAWLEKHIYRPFGLVPLIDSQGRVVLKSIFLPNADDVTPGSLFEFTSAKCTDPHPSWDHMGSEQVTRLVLGYMEEEQAHTQPDKGIVVQSEKTVTRDHDRVSDFGVHAIEVKAHGIHNRGVIWYNPFEPTEVYYTGALNVADLLARNWFDRFGDGAVVYRFRGLSAADVSTTEPGEFVKVTLASLPDPENQTRGGTQIVQMLSKQIDGVGYNFEALGVGPNLSVLTAPTVAIAQNTTTPKHAIDVTISSLPSAADGYVVQLAQNATLPGSTSELWGQVAVLTGTANETVTLDNLPSGTKFWPRIRATAKKRISSTWATGSDASTAALTAPTSASVSGWELTWANGETDYPIRIMLDDAACASATRVVHDELPAGTTKYQLTGLEVSTTYCVGVMHFDHYSGVSSESTHEFTTGSDLPDCPEPLDIYFVQAE